MTQGTVSKEPAQGPRPTVAPGLRNGDKRTEEEMGRNKVLSQNSQPVSSSGDEERSALKA